MSDYSLRVFDLGKRYPLTPPAEYKMFRDALINAATLPVRAARAIFRRNELNAANYFWALKNISFDVMKGEVVAIVGKNGAGKSTLLKILSRITDPTEGGADIYGRVGSLLEVGTGFHQEMTGRENVYMNGTLLGMRKFEIDAKMDEIIAFAEVEKFIDTPVKRYSSGMYMRLAFAVAAHLEPDVLVVDEVLAVGDVAFQKKCLGKMGEVAKHGRTVLFVSHNMSAVQALCSRAVLLEKGRVINQGPAGEIVQQFLRSMTKVETQRVADRRDRKGDGSTIVTSIRVDNADEDGPILCGSRLRITIGYQGDGSRALNFPAFSVVVNDMNNAGIMIFDSEMTGGLPDKLLASGSVTCVTAPLNLAPGRCYVNLSIRRGGELADSLEQAAFFDIDAEDFYGTGRLPERNTALCVLPNSWSLTPPTSGLTDSPSLTTASVDSTVDALTEVRTR